MRRFLFALTGAFALLLAFADAGEAVGPGGWSRVGNGGAADIASLNANVTALNTDNPGVLYVGGNFTDAGGRANADRIAKWNGAAWSAIGGIPLTNGQVFAIAYHAGTVYVGGTFQDAGGDVNADFLAAWNGTSWKSPCTSTEPGVHALGGEVKALQIIDNTLYVGGAFADGAGIDSADYLVACDLTTGVATSTVASDGGFNGVVYALTARSGILYAGGGFSNLAMVPAADKVAAYDGEAWHAMGSGAGLTGGALTDFVRSLTASGGGIYVGTDSLDIAGIAQADHVARWDGAAWHAVGANTAGTNGWFPASSTIDAMETTAGILIAAGSFQNANGIAAADQIAYFDGTKWRPIGSDGAGNGPLGAAHPTALGITQGQLYAGGNMTSAGGDTFAKFLAAHALRQPDAGISPTSPAGPVAGYVDGPFLGSNEYSATGAGQVRTATVTRGHAIRCYVRIQNDGIVPASFKIKGTGGATGFVTHYYRDGQFLAFDITAAVRDGTYATVSLDPRESALIRFEVHVANSSAASATFTTTARSVSGTLPDAVRLVVHATG
jgi:hypothetical protein